MDTDRHRTKTKSQIANSKIQITKQNVWGQTFIIQLSFPLISGLASRLPLDYTRLKIKFQMTKSN